MEKLTVIGPDPSRVVYTTLEQGIRREIQTWLQRLLEEEVTELLGREKSVRTAVGPVEGGHAELSGDPSAAGSKAYRNGHGKPRRLTTANGTIEVRRPRVRGLQERFESRILPLFARRTAGVGELLPKLYLHGLAQGDFDLALRGLLGEGAPLSPSSIARLKAGWQTEYEAWNQRSLADEEIVYVWADGIYIKAGLEKEKAALLVLIGARRDGSKTVLAVHSGYRESTESWAALLRDLKRRGMNCPALVMGDGALGLWAALAQVYPAAEEQRCWNHRMINVLDQVSKKEREHAKERLRQVMYADSRAAAERERDAFAKWADGKGFARAATLLREDWERMVAYYDFPQEHWKHLRTTNPVESPFNAVRLRTTAARRFKKVENATAVIWQTLLVAEKRFRKVNAPELLEGVLYGARYEDGKRRRPRTDDRASERKLAA